MHNRLVLCWRSCQPRVIRLDAVMTRADLYDEQETRYTRHCPVRNLPFLSSSHSRALVALSRGENRGGGNGTNGEILNDSISASVVSAKAGVNWMFAGAVILPSLMALLRSSSFYSTFSLLHLCVSTLMRIADCLKSTQ